MLDKIKPLWYIVFVNKKRFQNKKNIFRNLLTKSNVYGIIST